MEPPAQWDADARDLLSAVTDATSDLIHVKDLDGRYTMVNRAVAELVGRPASELVGLTPPEVFGGRGEGLAEHDRQVLESGQAELFEEQLSIDGEVRFFSSSKAPLRGPHGQLIGLLGISRDITELRRLEEAVADAPRREADDRFRVVLDSMLDLVTIARCVRDADGSIIDFEIEYMNRADGDIAGRSRDVLVGGSVLDLYPAMRGSSLFDSYVQAVETRQPVVIEQLPWEDKIDEEQVSGWFAVQIIPFGDRVVISSRDISGSIRDQQQLSDAFEQLNAAQSLAHIGVWTLDLTTATLTISDELYRIIGLAPGTPLPSIEEAIEQHVHPDDAARIQQTIEDMDSASEPLTTEIRIRRPDGTTRRLLVYGASRDPEGAADRFWGAAQDVTTQREAEEALRKASLSLSHEHQAVTLLQRAILPVLSEATAAEVAALYLPAGGESQVGGDWYDAFELDDHRIGLVVGDVAGHGIPAAGLMAQLRNVLRAHAFNDLSPADTFTTMNRLMERTRASGFATCLYAVLDLRSDELTWARAGHPPLMIHRDGSNQLYECPRDPPIGAIPGYTYAEETLALRSGDLLLLYTDGLIERRRESLDVGLRRLEAKLSDLATERVDVICERLCDEMLEGSAAGDDLCVLALRVPMA